MSSFHLPPEFVTSFDIPPGYEYSWVSFRFDELILRRVFRPIEPPPDRSGEAYHDAYAGGGFGGIPASAEAVAGLKRLKHGDDHEVSSRQTKRRRHGTGDDRKNTGEEAASCAICLEDWEDGDGLAVMPCTHRFHDGCLTQWLALSRLCPCCRHALPSEGDGKAPRAAMSTATATTTSVADGGGGRLPMFTREAATRRSRRVRQANVRLFGPEWTADTSDDGLGLQQ